MGSPIAIRTLNNIKTDISHLQSITFYTDGSMNPSLPNNFNNPCPMGFAWIMLDQNNSNATHTFHASTSLFPSSTKAECFAILTALLVSPPHSTINIYTDSLNCINTFNTFSRSSPRKNLKINNFLIWHAIFSILNNHSLNVQLYKVKAHSGNIHNDLADELAKSAIHKPELNLKINVHNKYLPSTCLYWSPNIVIDQDARHTLKIIQQFQQFNKLLKHPSLKLLQKYISRNQVDLKWTNLWFNHSPFDIPTCAKKSILQGSKIKYTLNILPTTDVLNRNYPKLIQPLLCFSCTKHLESNIHLWRCVHARTHLHNACSALKIGIINIFKDLKPNAWKKVRNHVMRMNIFQVDVHNPKLLRNNHPILMLFHQLIPKCISEIFSTFKLGHNLYKSHLLNLLSDFYKHLHINIWSSRSKLFKIWKQEHNIKKDDFKNYYKMHKNNNSTDNDPLRNNIPRKQRKPVTIFNHLNSNNTSSPIDDWIIWVSSNYLDNRPWHNTTFTFHPTI